MSQDLQTIKRPKLRWAFGAQAKLLFAERLARMESSSASLNEDSMCDMVPLPTNHPDVGAGLFLSLVAASIEFYSNKPGWSRYAMWSAGCKVDATHPSKKCGDWVTMTCSFQVPAGACKNLPDDVHTHDWATLHILYDRAHAQCWSAQIEPTSYSGLYGYTVAPSSSLAELLIRCFYEGCGLVPFDPPTARSTEPTPWQLAFTDIELRAAQEEAIVPEERAVEEPVPEETQAPVEADPPAEGEDYERRQARAREVRQAREQRARERMSSEAQAETAVEDMRDERWAQAVRAMVAQAQEAGSDHAMLELAQKLRGGIADGVPKWCPACLDDNIGFKTAIVVKDGREERREEEHYWTCFECGTYGQTREALLFDGFLATPETMPYLFGRFYDPYAPPPGSPFTKEHLQAARRAVFSLPPMSRVLTAMEMQLVELWVYVYHRGQCPQARWLWCDVLQQCESLLPQRYKTAEPATWGRDGVGGPLRWIESAECRGILPTIDVWTANYIKLVDILRRYGAKKWLTANKEAAKP